MKETINVKTCAVIFALGIAGGVSGYAISRAFADHNEIADLAPQQTIESRFVSAPSYFQSATPTEFTTAAEKCIDGVVHVKTKFHQEGYNDPFMQYFFGIPQGGRDMAMGSGSGVIISQDGYIVTNNHVIENSSAIEVVLNDRRTFEATLIGRDPSTDLALLKIDCDSQLTAIPFGNSDELKVGEWVLAIGNPFNLTSTVTSGIISAKARNINILESRGAIESFIQTDAAVNPGNSGGALVNTNGELVGINSAIASQTGSFTGYAFAVPTTIVKKVIADLKEYGKVQRAIIGIQIGDVTDEIAKQNNLKNLNGVYVAGVADNSGAYDAGIEKGDIITGINGKATKTCPELQEIVSTFRPGDKASIEYVHNGNRRVTEITFKDWDNNTSINAAKPSNVVLGATLEDIDQDTKDRLRIKSGAMVSDLEPGKFLSAGVRKNFIITRINGNPVKSAEDVQKIISNIHDDGVYIDGVYPNGKRQFYAFGL